MRSEVQQIDCMRGLARLIDDRCMIRDKRNVENRSLIVKHDINIRNRLGDEIFINLLKVVLFIFGKEIIEIARKERNASYLSGTIVGFHLPLGREQIRPQFFEETYIK